MGKHFIYHLILSVREDGKAFVGGKKGEQHKLWRHAIIKLRVSKREREERERKFP